MTAAGWRVTTDDGRTVGTGVADKLWEAWADAANHLQQRRLIQYSHLNESEIAELNGVYVNPASVWVRDYLVETYPIATPTRIAAS